ncbi:bifunctional 4'-phosphopantothenoylcysteine decarboxylase/phosphopantothenoylcysteine synthetase, partial [Candidatus Sumerlaeota bacterium]|nr:bifunctional 4'-phosphopantothenoylcysteine decarboxylase/phosphopantothenoylcysteine synthetase [Candidatus Sumerlaeota bacterium]
MFDGKRIVLGVSGGIAAYKAAHLARQLRKRGAEMRVVMTENATRFVTPLTFATLTQSPVCASLWQQPDSWSMEHISNARWGDLLVVAPATANVIAKFAHGIADDAL